ncbi:MAG: DUF6445 family protein [Pseudomonadota bacterium]
MHSAKLEKTCIPNQDLKISIQTIGREQNPLIIIDNFFAAPENLIALAKSDAPFVGQTTDYYPGLRKIAPEAYAEQSLEILAPLIRNAFNLSKENTARTSLCVFSLATTPTHKLRPIQCVPHIDTHDPYQFAMVHYLCSEHYGGTSFYRHRTTGHETITDIRLEEYFRILKHEVMTGGLPQLEYINGNTSLFERIAKIEVKFNRAIIYRSNALHAGDISDVLGLSTNPEEGRLTLNTFINFSN